MINYSNKTFLAILIFDKNPIFMKKLIHINLTIGSRRIKVHTHSETLSHSGLPTSKNKMFTFTPTTFNLNF